MSVSKFSAILGTVTTLAALVPHVAAHGFCQQWDVDNSLYSGYIVDQFPYETDPPAVIGWTEDATDLGFVSDYGSDDIICHKDATNAQLTATIAAGDDLTAFWTTWPDSHKGPVTDYLAPCNGDCSTVDKTTLKFFKIWEAGLIVPGSDQVWASDVLIANNNSHTVKIPSNLAPGNYVLRHEILALHSAGSANGAQAYPQCINIQITGDGTLSPDGTLGTELYTATDPGVLINIYTDLENYTIPGPDFPTGITNSSSDASGDSSSSSGSSTGSSSSSGANATSIVASASVATSVGTTPASTAVLSTPSATSAVTSAVTSITSVALPATTATPTTTAVAVSSGVASSLSAAISSLETALPSSVLTSAAPTATATTSSGQTVSTAGMTVAELLDLLKQILVQLFDSSASTSTTSKARRHARDIAV